MICTKLEAVSSEIVELESPSGTSSTEQSADELATTSTASPTPKRRPSEKVVTPQPAAALDRTLVSDRGTVHVITAAASSLSHDTNDLILNRVNLPSSHATSYPACCRRRRRIVYLAQTFMVHF